jgi:hypothetical protein
LNFIANSNSDLEKISVLKINSLHIRYPCTIKLKLPLFIHSFSAQSFQEYLGTYDRKEAKNYLEFLDDLGLNKLLKKAATASNPVLEVIYFEASNVWSFKTCTKITCNVLTFKIGEEYNRRTKDGREVITTAILNGKTINIYINVTSLLNNQNKYTKS